MPLSSSINENELRSLINEHIDGTVRDARTLTKYRRVLIGFADALDPDFLRLRAFINQSHRLPTDILPEARTVVSFFVPFSKEVVVANGRHPFVAEEWAIAYSETNRLIEEICSSLAIRLEREGVKANWELPTHNFDKESMTSYWSHKSVAKIAGLGSFGLNQMLITDSGCAGRFGSIITDASVTPTPKSKIESCLHLVDKSCVACVERCPNHALTITGLDKHKCYQRCLEADKAYSYLAESRGLPRPFDACGKCSIGPCSLKNPVKA